jgi:hypothetical protein
MGRIGVTWRGSGTLQGSTPSKGSCDGAGRGAVVGLLADLKVTAVLIGASAASGPGALLVGGGFLALGIALTPVYALFGSLYGMSAAPDAAAVEKATETIQRAIDARQLPRGIAESILKRAKVAIDDPLELLPPGSPSEGIDTILEVASPLILLQGPYNVNPTLRGTLLQTASLTRAADGTLLYRMTLVQPLGGSAEYLDWAKDDAALLRAELSSMDVPLGQRMLDEMFLLHALPTDREWKRVPP